jgi:hypothetical protein
MKSIIKVSFTIALALVCFQTSTAQFSKVKGNGNVTTKTHNTADYNKIKVQGFMNVTLKKGAEGTITVTTDENIQEYIIVETKKDALIIKVKNKVNIQTKKGVYINVPFNDLTGVSLTGSGDVMTEDLIKSDTFETELTGSGDVALDVEASAINAKITGSGDLQLSGNTNNLEVKVTGSGDFYGKELSSKNTEAYVSGSGDASVNASNRLKARVNGSGDISYYGNPEQTDKKVIGSGDIDAN